MPPDLDTFKLLGEALALGLLVGAERYRGRSPGEKRSAGVRTFAIFCLLGAISGLLASTAVTCVVFAAVAALVLLGYYRSPAESLGMTTEFAALLVFWVGYLLNHHEAAAISLGVVLTIFLASKRTLHGFVRNRISAAEFEATLKFLAVVLVVYPVLPNRSIGPHAFFNPRDIWGLVILVSTISYAGYFLIRWLGERRGVMLSGLIGGLVSTTAITMTLADRARTMPEASRRMGTIAVLANAVQGPRLLVLLWVVNPGLAVRLAPPLLGMAIAGIAGAWLLGRRAAGEEELQFPLQNPYSLKPALKFALLFVPILLIVKLANVWLGSQGIVAAGAIAGLASVSAVALSIGDLVRQGSVAQTVAAGAIVAGLAANALLKWTLARIHGTRQMAFWLGGGLVTMLAAAVLLLLV